MKMIKLDAKKMIVVDLYSGSYNTDNVGHECFNFAKNSVDGNYYGYCPRLGGVNITKLGARGNEQFVDGVLVIYVARKDNSSNREVIGFCLEARAFKTCQSGEGLFRTFTDKNDNEETSTYSIKSQKLCDLRNCSNKLEIPIRDYNIYMFRAQRFYGGKYPKLDKKIIAHITSILEHDELLDNDGNEEQEKIQQSTPASCEDIQNSANKPLTIVLGSRGREISKDSRITKSALIAAKYACAIDPRHETFITSLEKPYMEGHHLIPCTVANSNLFMERLKKNIDCFENIICLCPTCHREVHYGKWSSKAEKIKIMLKKHQEKMRSIGLFIEEEELLSLYKSGSKKE